MNIIFTEEEIIEIKKLIDLLHKNRKIVLNFKDDENKLENYIYEILKNEFFLITDFIIKHDFYNDKNKIKELWNILTNEFKK